MYVDIDIPTEPETETEEWTSINTENLFLSRSNFLHIRIEKKIDEKMEMIQISVFHSYYVLDVF